MKSPSPLFGASLLAALASASPAPQALNFDAIAAAQAVASGPVNDGVSNQTATLATTFTLTGATAPTAASKRSLDRRQSGSQVITGYNAAFGSQGTLTTVNSGSLYWLSGGSTHNWYGNVNNYGSIYISQSSYLQSNPGAGGQTCNWVGHDANNGNLNNAAGALIQLNDIGSKSAPTYDWYLHSILNNGTIQFCGRGDTGGSTFQFYSDLDAVNNGLISYEQAFSNKGASFAWRNPTLSSRAPSANIYNNGAFRLINTVHHNVQNIYGSGCWQLSVGAVLYLEDGTGNYQNPTGGPSFPGQSISFQDSSAVLHMDTAVYSRNSDFGAKVYGFGSGNSIEFYEYIKSYSYSSSSGILTVSMYSGNKCNINVGQGYDASKFYIAWNFQFYASYNAIFYKGSCPQQSAPSQCSISASPCGDLGKNPPTPKSSTSAGPTSTKAVTVSTSTAAPTTTTSSAIVSSTATTASSTSFVSSSSSISVSSAAPTSSSTVTPSTTTVPDTGSGTGTSSSSSACPTTPEDGTYCGFINPEDPCAPQPDGYGPVPTPDTASAFLAYPPFHSMASAAPTVVPSSDGTQYSQVFVDLNASTSAQSYIGLKTLHSYSVSDCAAACDAAALCTAFNIYIERDPSKNPTNNDSTAPTVWGYDCPNPSSITNYKCTLWGSNIDASTATNQGGYREQFQVVITGSNGYDKTNVTTPDQPTGPTTTDIPTATSSIPSPSSSAPATTSAPVTTGVPPTTVVTSVASSSSSAAPSSSAIATGTSPAPRPSNCPSPWNPPKNCHGKGIDAPKYWLGSYFFPGPYNPQACADFALGQNVFNKHAAQSKGQSTYTPCQMFNAYYLHKNGSPHGTYCTLYSTPLDESWATYGGGVSSNGDRFSCRNSWTFELTVHDSGKC